MYMKTPDRRWLEGRRVGPCSSTSLPSLGYIDLFRRRCIYSTPAVEYREKRGLQGGNAGGGGGGGEKRAGGGERDGIVSDIR